MCSPFQRISVVPCSHRIKLNQTSIALCNLSCQTAAPAAATFRACSRCSCRCCCILCCRRCCSTAAAALAAAAAAAQHLPAQLFESHNREPRPLGVWLNLQQLLRQSNVGTTKRRWKGTSKHYNTMKVGRATGLSAQSPAAPAALKHASTHGRQSKAKAAGVGPQPNCWSALLLPPCCCVAHKNALHACIHLLPCSNMQAF